jgi:exonuclease SbcC
MRWYRQPEVRTNNLYLTFAQFNFLDTDAAVGLAMDKDSPTRIQNDLSKLLVGSEASKTWDDMERVFDAVASRLRALLPLMSQVSKELTGVIQRLKESSSVVRESDSIEVRLKEMLDRLHWRVSEDEKELFAGSVVESLSEVVVLAQQASAIDWTESPVRLDGLTDYCREARAVIDKAEPDVARLELLLNNLVRLAGTNKNNQAALGIATEASLLIDRGIPKRLAQRSEDQRRLDKYYEWLSGLDASLLTVLSGPHSEMTVVSRFESAVQDRVNLEAMLSKAQTEYSTFVNLRDQVVSLGQELRQIAQRITEMSAEPDECPLCHTRFETGELQKHINIGIDQHVEATGQALLTTLRNLENQVQEIMAVEKASQWLRTFIEAANLPGNVSIRSALAEVDIARRNLEETRSRLEALNSELLALESEGLSGMEPDEISLRLQQFGYPLEALSRESVDAVITAIERDLAISSTKLQTERAEANELQQTVALNLGAADLSIREFTFQDVKSALSRLKERLATTESLQSKLQTLTESLPWPRSKPLAELALEVESVRTVAADLQAAIGREKQAETTHAESIQRKSQLEQQRDNLAPRIARLTKARDTLNSLRSDHSITEAMKEALDQNRAGIELIFSRIHSPAEFSGLGSTWTTLVRRNDGSEAKLSEISTGQRAAFALSIFLAQNAQLAAAPPVILIDDPIAHVDDLNCLSFLDYLREIVLTGRRQIFFATADDKLSTLFERKFDFLGPQGFRRFDLHCEASPIGPSV